MIKSNFRSDINSLRALAVVTVVLFHFNVTGFSGGFVGVDVFFVISGFLMTGIVARGLSKNEFSFISFYLARARRIIPALLFITLVLLLVGWFYLSPDDYVRLSREVDRALLFLSNNYFYKKSGYFDPDSHERLLLHTWSLSVEWQFYILYPVFLFFVSRINKKLVPISVVFILIISFCFSVFKSNIDSSYAFYMLPSRAWEMLLGGVAYYASVSKKYKPSNVWCQYLGLFFIVLSVFIYSPATVWPGIAALLPTVGTALVIYANKESFLTNNIVSQKLGDWSYSIYLWHWPFVVFLLLFDIEQSPLITVFLISLSVLFGALSYYFVESKSKNLLAYNNRLVVFILIFVPVALALLAAKLIRDSDGYIARVPENAYAVFDQANNKYHILQNCHKKRSSDDCIYGDGKIGAIVIGDSHAMSIVSSVTGVFSGNSVLDWSNSGCPTINGVQVKDVEPSKCNDFLSSRLNKLSNYSGLPILVANRFSSHFSGANEDKQSSRLPRLYLNTAFNEFSDVYVDEIYQGYTETLCFLAKNNPVYILKPTPELKLNVPEVMGRSLLIGQEKRVSVSLAEYKERNEIALRLLDDVASKCNVTLLDPIPYLCDAERCYGDVDGLPIFFDDDHLNMRGADLLKPLFEQRLLIK